ncbi:MAG: reverse transcriptase family protein, partial [Nitrososphaeraceae archaeon]|nr:reverse transcriptase family protein [Nitrososphaeraceae archaeon]
MSGNKSQSTIPTLIKDSKEYSTSTEKANLIASNLADSSKSSNYSQAFINHRGQVENDYIISHPTKNDLNPINESFSINELETAIKQSKNKSSPGPDCITYEMIKHLPAESLKILLELFNKSWDTGSLAADWKEALVLPLAKYGANPSDPNSYRPISLTSVLCKILERMIANRLTWYLEQNNLLNESQSGFRKNRSTIDQLIRLHDDVNKAIHNKGYTVAVLLDFTKAFDLVWKEGLLHKIRTLGIQGNMHNWISNFLTERTIRVKVGGNISDSFTLENGTPQGSVISPLLFLIMINDIPTVNDNLTKSSLFADDSAIWRSGKNLQQIIKNLQKIMNKICDWSDNWGFKISETKTVAIVFTKKRNSNQIKKLKINDKEIKYEKEAKFLGMLFDNKNTWNSHIKQLVDKCKSRINLLRSVTGHQWGANKKTLLMMYRALIRSRLDYGSQLFHTASATALKKLDTVQSTCLRIICGSMRGTATSSLQQDTGEMPLALRRKELQF